MPQFGSSNASIKFCFQILFFLIFFVLNFYTVKAVNYPTNSPDVGIPEGGYFNAYFQNLTWKNGSVQKNIPWAQIACPSWQAIIGYFFWWVLPYNSEILKPVCSGDSLMAGSLTGQLSWEDGRIPMWSNGGKLFTGSELFQSGGNIGVGTNTPQAKLDVTWWNILVWPLQWQWGTNGINFTTDWRNTGIGKTTHSIFGPYDAGNGVPWALYIWAWKKGSDDSRNEIILYNNGCSGERGSFNCNVPQIRLMADNSFLNGTVSVWTTQVFPGSKAQIDGSVRAKSWFPTDFSLNDASNVGYWFDADGDTGIFRKWANINTADSLALFINNRNALHIKNSTDPYIGIWTDNPQAKLDVNGKVRIFDWTQQDGSVFLSDANWVGRWSETWPYPCKVRGGVWANTCYGSWVLQKNESWIFNSWFWFNSLQENSAWRSNTAHGVFSLQHNTIGDFNSAFWVSALIKNSVWSSNTAIGWASLEDNTTWSGNTAVWYNAWNNISTWNNNIAIGANTAFPNPTWSNQLNIGNWIYGQNGNIGISANNPLSQMQVSGKFDNSNSGSFYVQNNKFKDPSWSVQNISSNPSENNYLAAGVWTQQAVFVTSAPQGYFWKAGATDADNTREDINQGTEIMNLSKDGDLTIKRNLNVWGNSSFSGLSVNGPLTVEGITNFHNNVFMKGDVVIGSGKTIGFENPDDVPWMPRNTNLPFVKFGWMSYIKPQILWSFNGQVIPGSAGTFFLYEKDGSLAGLRYGFNGEQYATYYMYAADWDANKLTLTNQKFEPVYLKWTGLSVGYIWARSADSIAYDVLNASGTVVWQHLLYNIKSLDSSTLTQDKVIDLSDNSLFPAKTCNSIPEKRMLLCASQHPGWESLYLYTLNSNNKPVPVSLFNTLENTNTNLFFNTNDTRYVQRVGSVTDYVSHWARNNRHIHTYVNGDFLYAENIFWAWNPKVDWSASQSNSVKLLFKINVNTASPDYGKVYYENQLPIKLDWTKVNMNGWSDFSLDMAGAIEWEYSVQYFPNKKEVIATYTHYWEPSRFHLYRYENVSSIVDFWKWIYSHGSAKINGTMQNASLTLYTPYDASPIGKSLSYTRFIWPNDMISYSYSNEFGSTPKSQWVKMHVNDYKTTRTVLDAPALPLVNWIENIDTDERNNIKSTFIDQWWNMFGYYLKWNQVYKYISNNGTSNLHATLPSDFSTTINTIIQNTPQRVDAKYWEPIATLYNNIPRILNDEYLLVPYGFVYKDANTQKRIWKSVNHYLLFRYSNNSLQLVKQELNVSANVDAEYYTCNGNTCAGKLGDTVQASFLNPTYDIEIGTTWLLDSATYISTSGNLYISYISSEWIWTGNGFNEIHFVRIDMNNAFALTGSKHYQIWYEWGMAIGIHPYYGVYRSYSWNPMRTNTRIFFSDRTTDANLDSRLTGTFDDWINSKQEKNIILATVRQAEWFIIYTANTPLFVDGFYTTLSDFAYDLTDPQYGLSYAQWDDSNIKNKLIYVYIDPSSSSVRPKLAFSFTQPNRPVIALVTTNNYWIQDIIVKDWVEVTAETLYAQKVNVTNHIEMRWDNGIYYKIYINAAGTLVVEPLQQ